MAHLQIAVDPPASVQRFDTPRDLRGVEEHACRLQAARPCVPPQRATSAVLKREPDASLKHAMRVQTDDVGVIYTDERVALRDNLGELLRVRTQRRHANLLHGIPATRGWSSASVLVAAKQ